MTAGRPQARGPGFPRVDALGASDAECAHQQDPMLPCSRAPEHHTRGTPTSHLPPPTSHRGQAAQKQQLKPYKLARGGPPAAAWSRTTAGQRARCRAPALCQTACGASSTSQAADQRHRDPEPSDWGNGHVHAELRTPEMRGLPREFSLHRCFPAPRLPLTSSAKSAAGTDHEQTTASTGDAGRALGKRTHCCCVVGCSGEAEAATGLLQHAAPTSACTLGARALRSPLT